MLFFTEVKLQSLFKVIENLVQENILWLSKAAYAGLVFPLFELYLKVVSGFYLLCYGTFVGEYPNLIRPILKNLYILLDSRIYYKNLIWQ